MEYDEIQVVLSKRGSMVTFVFFSALVALFGAQIASQPAYGEPVFVYAEPVASPVSTEKPKKPTVDLRCTPKIGFSTPGNPVLVTAMFRIKNPGEYLWCPEIQWFVNGQLVSGHEEDCNPYEEETGDREFWREPSRLFGFYDGEYTIEAKVLKSGRVIYVTSCSVQIR